MGFSDPPSAETLDRYLSGTCTPEERSRVAEWVALLPAGERGIAMLRAMSPDDVRPVDIDQQWNTLTKRIHDTSSPSSVNKAGAPLRPPAVPVGMSALSSGTRSWWRIMLVPVCAVALLVAGWMTATHHLSTKLSGGAFTYTTGNGERARITLPDGSQVTLNVASRLDVPSDFSMGNRTLSLQGEALFTVRHESRTPFVVTTASTTTRVLGTRFIVREYDADTVAVVAVQDGKVAVDDVVVVANQELAVHHGALQPVRPVDHRRFGFDRGTLVLDSVLLKDAIPDLNRWFDAHVQLGDPSLATRILSGDCTTGSVANLAELLELTFDIKVVRKGKTLTLYSRDS